MKTSQERQQAVPKKSLYPGCSCVSHLTCSDGDWQNAQQEWCETLNSQQKYFDAATCRLPAKMWVNLGKCMRRYVFVTGNLKLLK